MLEFPGRTKIRLMRHASGTHMASQADKDKRIIAGRAPDARLATKGLAEARQTGIGLRSEGYQPDRVMSSKLERAAQTARIVVAELVLPGQLELIQDSGLDEQCLGGSEGQLWKSIYDAEMRARYDKEGANVRHPGRNREGLAAETLTEVIARELKFIASLRAEEMPPKEVLAVGHHTAIKGLVAAIRLGVSHHAQVADVDPFVLNQAMLDVEAIEPCGTTLVMADGPPDNLHLSVAYVGKLYTAT